MSKIGLLAPDQVKQAGHFYNAPVQFPSTETINLTG